MSHSLSLSWTSKAAMFVITVEGSGSDRAHTTGFFLSLARTPVCIQISWGNHSGTYMILLTQVS